MKRYMPLLGIMLPIIMAIVCLWTVIKTNNQANMPVPRELTFVGEYSYDGENWYLYSEDSDISALTGDIVVKGHLDGDIAEGAMLNFFCNHIGVSVYINGEMVYIDTPAEIKKLGIDLLPSMCGKRWEKMICPVLAAEDEIEFHFINYHKHGNKYAYKEALSSLLMTPPDNTILEVYLKPHIKPFEFIGYALLIVAVMLLGSALAAVVFKSSMVNRLFKIGIMTLFVAGYMVFDVMMVYLMDELLVMKTYGRQLCLMLAVYFLGIIICDAVKGRYKKVAEIVMGASGIINMLIIALVITGKILLYDTQFLWELVQYGVSLLLIILCVLEIKRQKINRIVLIVYIFVNIAILCDMAGVGYHRYYSGICFKVFFVMMLIVFLFHGVKQMILNHNASIKNKKLKAELENSHIALMLSQIQPHFIYNTLGTIGEFCEEDPKQAASLVQKFSLYLRGNFTELNNPMPIRLSKEIEHVRHYADIEQIRFPDMKIEYDIQNDNFLIPALTIQPLVENAIKHGLMGLESGGTVEIASYESDNYYEVCVKDNGVGFEDSVFDDGKKHIGIRNIRKRIESMCGGTLTIDSVIGKGTVAIIRIPKEGAERDSVGGR